MKITVEHIPVETASDEDKWVITTHTENSNMLFYGEISEAVYDALKYQQQKIKELKEGCKHALEMCEDKIRPTENDLAIMASRLKQALKTN